MVKCQNCGAEVVGSDFCFNCGEKVEKFEGTSDVCPKCGTKNDKNTENSHRNIEQQQNQITANHIKNYPTRQRVG